LLCTAAQVKTLYNLEEYRYSLNLQYEDGREAALFYKKETLAYGDRDESYLTYGKNSTFTLIRDDEKKITVDRSLKLDKHLEGNIFGTSDGKFLFLGYDGKAVGSKRYDDLGDFGAMSLFCLKDKGGFGSLHTDGILKVKNIPETYLNDKVYRFTPVSKNGDETLVITKKNDSPFKKTFTASHGSYQTQKFGDLILTYPKTSQQSFRLTFKGKVILNSDTNFNYSESKSFLVLSYGPSYERTMESS
jgi:hypothetical protein